MSILKRYDTNTSQFVTAKLKYNDSVEFLDIVTEGKEYEIKLDPNIDLTPGRTVTLNLDNINYSYSIQSGDFASNILTELENNISGYYTYLSNPQILNLPTTKEYCSDTFTGSNGNDPSSLKWDKYTSAPVILNNSLSATFGGSSTSKWIRSKFYLQGDFDITVNFDVTGAPSIDRWDLSLGLQDSQDRWFYMMRAYEAVNGGHDYRYNSYVNSVGSDIGKTTTTHNTGILRFTRVGTMLRGYYWNGSSYTELGSGYNLPTIEDIRVYLYFETYNNNPTVTASYDNFTINSVDSIAWISPFGTYTSYDSMRIKPRPYIYDNFTGSNGDFPDSKLWNQPDGVNGSSPANIQNNALFFSSSGTGTASNSYSRVISKFLLEGDFDIQVDYSSLVLTHANDSTYPTTIRMDVRFASNSVSAAFIGPGYYNSIKNWFFSFRTLSNTVLLEDVSQTRTNDFGKIRIVRLGTTLTVYSQDGNNNWAEKGTQTHSDFSLPMCVYLMSFSNHGNLSYQGNLDNFKINYTDKVANFTTYIPDRYIVSKDWASDNFTGSDGSSPDANRWTTTTLTLENNTLKFDYINNIYKLFSTNYYINGNFNIQTDYTLSLWDIPSSGYTQYFRFTVYTDGTANNRIIMSRVRTDSNNYIIVSQMIDGVWQTLSNPSVNVSDTSGKFKFIKNDTSVECYYWNGSAFVLLITVYTNYSTAKVYYEFLASDKQTKILIDNFIVSSADNININKVNTIPRVTLNNDIISCKKLPYLKLINPQ